MQHRLAALLLAVVALVALTHAAHAAPGDSGAEITLRADERSAAGQGPLALAESLQPGIAPATASGVQLQAELHHTLRLPAGLALRGNGLLAHERLHERLHARPQGQRGHDRSRVNELHSTFDLGSWQLAAGKKVLGWDVGYGFRPNDMVQQEVRRTQFGQTPEGRPLLMAEHFGRAFGGESALALVLVNPQRWHAVVDRQRGAREAALAARAYIRIGGLDLHGFARHGRHTGASVGAALSWVAGDELELHASARAFRRHDGWARAGDALVSPLNPWQQTTLGGGSQWLLGGQWTGSSKVSLLFEAWHDGSALSDAAWRDWGTRNNALAALSTQAAWRSAAAGYLAWQATPFEAQSQRRDNVFMRLAWQPEDWTVSLDGLLTPADRGRVISTTLQWKGERWRLDASLRFYGGPATSLLAQLPLRRSALLAATLAF